MLPCMGGMADGWTEEKVQKRDFVEKPLPNVPEEKLFFRFLLGGKRKELKSVKKKKRTRKISPFDVKGSHGSLHLWTRTL